MFGIEIIAVPQGEAPLGIREAWLGMILPCTELVQSASPIYTMVGVLSGTRYEEPAMVYKVFGADAISALVYEGRVEAARFWAGVIEERTELTFFVEECEKVELSERLPYRTIAETLEHQRSSVT